ncbi:MAG: glycosyltransferase family 4 protein [Kiritimatiellaeota bacterium]|nr:glycosyltransferase family 4 protein [Kiritimatiellota bacterium]
MESILLYLTARYPVHSETFVRQDIALLREQGLPLLVATLAPGDCRPKPEWPKAVLLGNALAAGNPTGQANKMARALPPSWRRRVAVWRRRHSLQALIDLVRRHGIRHIHAEFADIAAVLAAAASRRLGLTYSVGVHARDAYVFRYDVGGVLAPARMLTVCNRAALDRLRELFADQPGAPPLHVAPHGVVLDDWPFEPRVPRPGDTARPFRVLFVGRLVEKKGLPVLLHAAAQAIADGFPVTVAVIGAGPLERAWRTEADRTVGQERIEWLGRLSRADVRKYIRDSDCLAVPSIVASDGDRDGIPNVIIEAMASGTPVAAAMVGGIPEVLNARTGWPFPPGNSGALAPLFQAIREQPETVHTKLRAARERVEAEFDARKLARARAALFWKALAGSGPPPNNASLSTRSDEKGSPV